MPNVSLPLSDVAQSVTRPVIDSVIKDIQKILSIDDLYLIYPGDSQKVKQPNTTVDDEQGNRDPKLSSERHAVLEVSEKLLNAGIGSNPGHAPEYPPVFYDNNLGFLIRPQYAFTEVELTYKYVSDSRVEVMRWYNECYSKAGELRQNAHLHAFDYHFNIPPIVVELLEEIYKRREAVGGFGDSFDEYFRKYSVPRFTYNTDLVGKHSVLSVTERQARVVGVLQWEGIPDKPEKEHDKKVWTAQFTYKFTFEKPVGINFKYPISVHNQMLPLKFIKDTCQEDDLRTMPKRFSYSHDALYQFEMPTIIDSLYKEDDFVRMPKQDDFVINNYQLCFTPVFSALCIIDPKDPTLFMNLRELDGYSIDERVLDFLAKGEYKYIHSNFSSFFKVTLYIGNRPSKDTNIYVDKDLNVRSTIPINIRNQQRIVFGLINDFSYLRTEAVVRVLKDREIVAPLLYYLDEAFKSSPQTRPIFLDTKVKLQDLLDIGYKVGEFEKNKKIADEAKPEDLYDKKETYTGGINPVNKIEFPVVQDSIPRPGKESSIDVDDLTPPSTTTTITGSTSTGSTGGSGSSSSSGTGSSSSSSTTNVNTTSTPAWETTSKGEEKYPYGKTGNSWYDYKIKEGSQQDEYGVVTDSLGKNSDTYVKIKDFIESKGGSNNSIINRKTQLKFFIQAHKKE